jgi:hypothetical protein
VSSCDCLHQKQPENSFRDMHSRQQPLSALHYSQRHMEPDEDELNDFSDMLDQLLHINYVFA